MSWPWGGFGRSVHLAGRSGLGFRGNQALPQRLIPSVEFELGTLRHFNNPVFPPTVTSTELAIELRIRELPAAPSFTFTYRAIRKSGIRSSTPPPGFGDPERDSPRVATSATGTGFPP